MEQSLEYGKRRILDKVVRGRNFGLDLAAEPIELVRMRQESRMGPGECVGSGVLGNSGCQILHCAIAASVLTVPAKTKTTADRNKT